MKVKNLVPWAGENFSYRPGEIIDLNDEIAKDRIAAGLCEAITETATADTPKQRPSKK